MIRIHTGGVAESIKNDIAAGNSWQVALKDDGRMVWMTLKDGVVTETFDTEPMTSAVQRVEAADLEIIPDSSEM